jgi:hypothetical protein
LWNALPELLKSEDWAGDLRVVVGRTVFEAKQPFCLCLERLGKDKKEMSVWPEGLAGLFDESQHTRQNIVNAISVTDSAGSEGGISFVRLTLLHQLRLSLDKC